MLDEKRTTPFPYLYGKYNIINLAQRVETASLAFFKGKIP